MNVSPEAAELRHDCRRLEAASMGECRGELGAPIDAKPGTFASIVKRCKVAFLCDRDCVPSYTVAMIEFDEPPWDRFLDKPWGRFICPGCGQTLDMHVSHGPGTPGTERFQEASALNY